MRGPLLDALSVARKGPGRPRTRPDVLRGDKAYSSRATRQTLRRRGIKAVIPEPRDQQQHRRNRGSRGGRPVGFDMEAYRGRNVIERGYSDVKQWRDRKSTRLNSSHVAISYAVFCLKKKRQ